MIKRDTEKGIKIHTVKQQKQIEKIIMAETSTDRK